MLDSPNIGYISGGNKAPVLTSTRTFNLLLVNTNGLQDRPIIREEATKKKVLVGKKDKIALLQDIAHVHKLDAAGLVKIHGYNLNGHMFHCSPHQSLNKDGRGGTALVVFNNKITSSKVGSGSNWNATQLALNGSAITDDHNAI